MNELNKNLTSQEKELVINLLNNEILQMARGIEFRQDKKEVMEKLKSYTDLLDKIN
ncbi:MULTISPECIES: hypothetical protein [unclassified Romboutsia]|uniref:hypothetical protein n=1 Tax=unclassified Romboutsia TaxID=2626894 RepID=UPI000821EC61|nr:MULTISPECIES: hypothetical protein [unclassified Romboutsia]SCI52418.1 Uncharacterised protein [uncultured Clostridium sp.]